MKQLILASNSPRRRELMAKMDYPFMAKGVMIEEHIDDTLPLEKAIEQVAYQKALAVQPQFPDNIIIGADTVVCVDNEVLGKPKDAQDAIEMLSKLSGRTHQVITGVCILNKTDVSVFHQVSDVQFYTLSKEEIIEYVNSKEPMDKAGAYGIQGKGAFLVEKIVGDYYNIVGLPMAELSRRLKTMG